MPSLGSPPPGVHPPTIQTLVKYGLDTESWLALLKSQNWQCPICRRSNQRWTIDHEHVYGWKKMIPGERRRYVRGILCVRCNWKIVNSIESAETIQRVADYLKVYEARRDGRAEWPQ